MKWNVKNGIKFLLKLFLPESFVIKLRGINVRINFKIVARLNKLPFKRSKYKDGINLIGSIQAEIGLGQSCRLIANVLELSRIKYMIYNYAAASSIHLGDNSWNFRIGNEPLYNVNLIHLNPYEMNSAYVRLDKRLWKNRYNIAFWLWESNILPQEWMDCLPCIDEIWTPSEYVSNIIKEYTSKPVITIPYFVVAPIEEQFNREFFNLPKDKFLFMIMFDGNSTMLRKNPIGAIKAYKKAFPKEKKDVGMVIKLNNVSLQDVNFLREQLVHYQNIYFITDTLTKIQVNGLIKCIDVFVSLHRAEGFGLVLAEAMILGTPTIATNWSANVEFMTDETACLVDCKLIMNELESGPYVPGNIWAEPNLDQAADYMKCLVQDEDLYFSISKNAMEYIQERQSLDRITKILENRLNEIYTKNEG